MGAREAEVVAMNEVYKAGQGDLEKLKASIEDIKRDYQAIGQLQKIGYDQAHDEFCKYYVLYKVKERKAHKTAGMTWEEFCKESVNESERSVDMKLKDMKPLYEKFSEKFSLFVGVDLSKIRLLGRLISEKISEIKNNEIVINGQAIPLDPEYREELAEALDEMMKTSKAEKDVLSAELKKLRRKADEIVGEATKGIKMERDALIEQNKKLKDQLKTAKPATIEDLEVIREYTTQLTTMCRNLLFDQLNELSNEDKGTMLGMIRICLGEIHDLKEQFETACHIEED